VRAARNGIEGEGAFTLFRGHLDAGARGGVRTYRGELWTYLCLSCGRVEWKVHDPQTMAFVREHWIPVAPPAPPQGA